jgi:hypothetical protein
MKRIRKSFGYTHQKQKENATGWYSLAKSFHLSAQVLDENKDRIPSDSRPFALNSAISLELIFKAILTKKNLPFPKSEGGHDLCAMCAASRVKISGHQIITLELMTEELLWAARYPVPKTERRWDNFQDVVVERHIVRSQAGKVSSTRANSKTFPNWENYMKIWNCAVAELEATPV